MLDPMVQLLRLLCGALIGLIQSSARREAEILIFRHQINVLGRKSPKRQPLNNADRLLFVWLFRMIPTTLSALTVTNKISSSGGHHGFHRKAVRCFARWRRRIK
jgi:hypothetical protein